MAVSLGSIATFDHADSSSLKRPHCASNESFPPNANLPEYLGGTSPGKVTTISPTSNRMQLNPAVREHVHLDLSPARNTQVAKHAYWQRYLPAWRTRDERERLCVSYPTQAHPIHEVCRPCASFMWH